MEINEYGPFANIVTLAGALVATFAFLFLKVFGSAKRWTWLISDAPPFMIKTGPRMLAIGVMALTYVTISKANYPWFAVGAVVSGVLGFVSLAYFDALRRNHIHKIPLLDQGGNQLSDKKGNLLFENVVIGTEADMRPEAKVALKKIRAEKGGVSLGQFLSGYGAQKVNDPESAWDRTLLSKISSRLTLLLMGVFLFGVLALFLAAFVIEVSERV